MVDPGRGVVLASRTDAYSDAVLSGDTFMQINGAAGIELRPLSPVVVLNYLQDTSGGRSDRWDGVVEELRSTTDSPVVKALRTPLSTFLARAVYNDHSAKTSAQLEIQTSFSIQRDLQRRI